MWTAPSSITGFLFTSKPCQIVVTRYSHMIKSYLAIATPKTHPPTVDQKPIHPASTWEEKRREEKRREEKRRKEKRREEKRREEKRREEKRRLFSVQNAVHDCGDRDRQRAGTKCLKSTETCQSLRLVNCLAALLQEQLCVCMCVGV